MMPGYKLVAPTEIVRATLKREIQTILPPDAHGRTRRVTVMLPEGQTAFIAPDILVMTPDSNSVHVPIAGQAPPVNGIGPNESYRLPQWPQGQVIFFWLLSGQTLMGASQMEVVYASLIVEYWG